MTEIFSGRCLCVAVHFEARGRPKGIFWCHCNSCRRHSGALVSVFVGFENDAVAVTEGTITTFKSSLETARGFGSGPLRERGAHRLSVTIRCNTGRSRGILAVTEGPGEQSLSRDFKFAPDRIISTTTYNGHFPAAHST